MTDTTPGRGIVAYDTWCKARVQAAQSDPRPAIEPAEWDAIRAKKLAQRKALADKRTFPADVAA